MGTESIEASFLSIFALISFFIFFITSKYSYKIKNGALLDIDFIKPQAFHKYPVSRSGGVGAIICLSIFFSFYYLLYSKILYNYLFISFTMFFIGFLDDLKILSLNLPGFETFLSLFVILNFFLVLVLNFIIFSYPLFSKHIDLFL